MRWCLAIVTLVLLAAQLGTASALAALARVINGDPEPLTVPRPVSPVLEWRW
jgi:hypothetical protein